MIPSGALWVRMPRFIGDGVMIAQAVAPLRALGHELVAWGPAPVVELFDGAEPFAGTAPDPVRKPSVLALRAVLKEHHAAGVLNLPRSQRATLAALAAGLPLRVGWASGPAVLLPTHWLDYARTPGHQRERYAALLGAAFPALKATGELRFLPRPAAMAEARGLLSPLGREPYAVLALGAMSWSKRLGDDRFVDAARHLVGRGLRPVLLGAPGEDQEHGALIASLVPEALDLTGRTPLSVAAGVLAGARVALGNDSALSHLAAACGVPVVVAFGPTDPAVTRPRGPWVRVVRDESLPCLVCQQGACNVPGHPCMKKLEPSLLAGALDEALVAGIPAPVVPEGRP